MSNIVITENDLKIIKFFKSEIRKEAFAKHLRRMLHINTKMMLEGDSDYVLSYKDWVNEGQFWLNEFAEFIDPYLDKEIED
jgi:hypothetical protein